MKDEGEEHGCCFISMHASSSRCTPRMHTHTHTHTLRRALPHCRIARPLLPSLLVPSHHFSLSRNVLPPPKKVVHHFVFIRNVEDAAVEVRLV